MSEEPPIETQRWINGIVIRAEAGLYTVRTDERSVLCTLRGRLKDGLYEEADDGSLLRRYADPVAVGDEVRIAALGEEGVIEEIQPRRTKLSRLMAKPHDNAPDVEQVIVANVDQVVIVASVRQPRLNLRFIDRLLVLAEYGGAGAFLCLNKCDLLDEAERGAVEELLTRVYASHGVRWMFVSAIERENIRELQDVLRTRFSVFVGASGVGKSSLLNALQPSLHLRTAEIRRASRKGRHTTTHVELHEMDFGAWIADTPGLREVGMWGVPTDSLDYYFVEMRPYLGKCRFGDCWHFDEPGCAVRAAVEQGKISSERYANYRRLCQEGPIEAHERRIKRLR